MGDQLQLEAKVTTEFDGAGLQRRADDGTYRNLGHGAASLRLVARRSIAHRPGPSAAGQPPHTHTDALPDSILYHVDRRAKMAVIGPAESRIGQIGAVHERGEAYMGDDFEPRPFMAPALVKIQDRLPENWRNSITG